ncbi:EAL domain-containing protein [Uliginosibacterium sp. H1]|uniref:EAL domain-containing protein n=1 Tax=Uliginosibacterium sp. H1 TaxID=3114757 RepID=UPI002E181497|nr:EAL domain-containing protein [Uliginosibacterium sp. H1]
MDRRRSWFLTFCAVAIGVCVPLAAALMASRMVAEHFFRARVDEFSSRVLLRAELVVQDALEASQQAERFVGSACGQDHLLSMRRAELEHRYVREIIHVHGDTPLCSSWSEHETRPPLDMSRWRRLQGNRIWYRIDHHGEAATPLINFRVGQHVVVVDPRFYVDIVPLDSHIRLGVLDTKTGEVIAAWSNTEQSFLQHVLIQVPSGSVENGRYVDIRRSDKSPMAVVAYEPLPQMTAVWVPLLFIALPIGLGISGLLTWLLLRCVSRMRGPQHSLTEALRRDEFFVCYQPVVAMDSGRCTGAEALIRWRLPDGRVVTPDSFIPMAESIGMIRPITDWLVKRVVADLGAMLSANPALHVSINLAPQDLQSPVILDYLGPLLKRAGVRPEQIWFEVIERGFVNNVACRQTIDALRAAGHPVYIDDFGTGYSSLSYLQDMHVDGLKIDKSFVDTMSTDAATRSVAPHIIRMASELGIKMVAEGVETDEQRRLLQAQGVGLGQGWLFARAMPMSEFRDFLRASTVGAVGGAFGDTGHGPQVAPA